MSGQTQNIVVLPDLTWHETVRAQPMSNYCLATLRAEIFLRATPPVVPRTTRGDGS